MEYKLGSELVKFLVTTKTERDIAAFRNFYITHLQKIKNRKLALQDLAEINQQFASRNPIGYVYLDKDYHKLITSGREVLTKHFSPPLVALYNKSLDEMNLAHDENRNKYDHFLFTLLNILTGTFEKLKDLHQKRFNYQKNLLTYVHSCLY